MKYWYFKGEDVAGPLPVEEIVKDENFSADTFVCPEHESDNSESWKSADQYMQDFGYILDPEHYSKPEPEPEPELETKETSAQSAGGNTPSAEPVIEKANEIISQETTPSDFVQAEPEELNIEEPPLQDNIDDIEPEPIFTMPKPPVEPKKPATPKQETIEDSTVPSEESVAVYTSDLPKQELPAADESVQSDEFEETIHSRSPLNAGMDDNLLDEIPASAVLSPEETPSAEGNIAKTEDNNIIFDETVSKENEPKQDLLEEQALENKLEETKSGLEQLEKQREAEPASLENSAEQALEALDTFTVTAPALHIAPTDIPDTMANEVSVISAASQEPSGADILQDREEESEQEENDGQSYDIMSLGEEDDIKEIFPNHAAVKESHEANNALLSVQDSVNSQFVKSAPTTTGKIISSSDGRVSDRKNKKNDTIYLMVMFMFVLIIVALMMMFTSEKNKEAQPASKQKAEIPAQQQAFSMDEPIARSVIQGYDEGRVSPEVVPTVKKSTPSLPGKKLEQPKNTPESMAIYAENLIKEYRLSSGKTIEEHFDETYTEPYKKIWKSTVLHGKIYVVDFFASKVRSEPIRYMFRVDVESKEIAGFNSNASDLVGKNLSS